MDQIIQKLKELLYKLDTAREWDISVLIDSKNKLRLYLSKYFKDKENYLDQLSGISIDPNTEGEYHTSIIMFKSLITTLIEDIQLTGDNTIIQTEEQRQAILDQIRKESEIQRERIEIEARQIQKLREDLQKDQQKLILEQEKFNDFKSKLELSDKRLDFSFQALQNRKSSILWALLAICLIGSIIVILFQTLSENLWFSDTAELVKKKASITNEGDKILPSIIYFTFWKHIFTKILLYSIFIYAIVFCIKITMRKCITKSLTLTKQIPLSQF